MVEKVENLRAKLHLQTLGDDRALHQGEAPILRGRHLDKVARHGSNQTGAARERGAADIPGGSLAARHGPPVADKVEVGAEADARRERISTAACDADVASTHQGGDAGNLPAAEQPSRRAALRI